MRYAITLTFQSGGMLQLPILPEKLKVSSPGKNKTATVLGIGEVLLLRLKGLRSVSWDSFFPASSSGPTSTSTRRWVWRISPMMSALELLATSIIPSSSVSGRTIPHGG